MADLKAVAENLINGKAPAMEEGVRQALDEKVTAATAPKTAMATSHAVRETALFTPDAAPE